MYKHIIYHKVNIPLRVREILKSEDDPLIYPQEDIPKDKEAQINILNSLCLVGNLLIFEYNGVLILLTKKTKYVANMDTKVSDKASIRDVIAAYKEFTKWVEENTSYLKIETRTPLEKYAKVCAKSCGWTIEGTHKNSFMTKDNKMVDEYTVGKVLLHNKNKGEA